MAGYSGTPLPKKLGIKEGHTVCLVGALSDFDTILRPLPAGVTVRAGMRGKELDVVLLFVKRRSDFEKRFVALKARLAKAGGLWVCWPKKSSGVATDVTESVVREFGLSTGLVDNKICAVDETWSGLRFVIRVKDR